jgi:hypothetical protein
MHLCQLVFDILPAGLDLPAEIRISEVKGFGLLDLRVSPEIANSGFAPSAPGMTGLFPNSVLNSF